MSIIHGIFSFNHQPAPATDIQTMLQATEAFADAGSGHRNQETMLLGANLLKTLPTGRHETEPVVYDAESGLSIVADARIDNRDALLDALGIHPSEGQHCSDTRLILQAYQRWNQDCADKLIGDFAFAIWNQRQQTLFCCRDVFAIRPLYYYHSDDCFIFSSDLLALLALPQIPTQLDEGYIASQIGGLHLYSNNTPYQHIHCLGKAQWMQIQASGQVSSECYWQPDLQHELILPSDEAYVERYLQLFTQAVNCRLVSDDPIASFISGGLDSSSIAAVAGRLLQQRGQQVHSYCHVLPAEQSNPKEDEKDLVTLLAQQAGINNTWVSHDRFASVPTISTTAHDPFATTKQGFMQTSLALAQQQGCKVMLEGFGGDQVATCHAHSLVYWQLRNKNVKGFYQQAKALANDTQHSLPRALASLIYQHHPFQSSVTTDSKIRQFLLETCVFNPEFYQRYKVLEMARNAHRFSAGNPATFKESIWKSLNEGVNPHNSLAATFSRVRMEGRQPMFDRRLVEFCLAVPAEQHRLGQYGRRLIRRAMHDILPDAIRMRHNKRYSSNPGVQQYLATDLEKHHNTLDESQAVAHIADYINLDEIRQRLQQLPALVAEGRQKEFKLGATMRALELARFMLHHHQWVNR